jgi:folate-binding protein YgfZ
VPATRLFDRALVRVSPLEEGEDVAGFLQGLVTNDVTGALPVWAGLLTAQGKALFEFIVWPAGDDLLLDCEAEAADALAKRLSLYRLRRKIGIAVDPGLAVHWRDHSGDGAADDPRLSALGQRWIAPAAAADESADAAWLAHRLKLGVAEGRAELGSDATLWLECNAAELHGVSFAKGCYIGQENTARMNWRQKVNRRLVVVPLSDSDPKRQRVTYPELGLAVDHRRVEDIDPALAPQWMDRG